MLIVFSFTRNCKQPECNYVGEICPSHGGHHFMEAIDRQCYRARRTRGIERALSPTSAPGFLPIVLPACLIGSRRKI